MWSRRLNLEVWTGTRVGRVRSDFTMLVCKPTGRIPLGRSNSRIKRNLFPKRKRPPDERHKFTRFDNHRCHSQCMWTHWKMASRDAIYTVCSYTLILFWLRKTSVIVEKFQLIFPVYFCLSFRDIFVFSVNFLFLFLFLCYPYFGTFPFHVVSRKI